MTVKKFIAVLEKLDPEAMVMVGVTDDNGDVAMVEASVAADLRTGDAEVVAV